MKKLLALSLVMLVGAMSAATLRLDVAGNRNVKISPVHGAGIMRSFNPSWYKDPVTKAATVIGEAKLSAEAKSYKLAFKAMTDGAVRVFVKGQWSGDAAKRYWLEVSNIKVDGKLIANGDFAKLNAKKLPEGFGVHGKPLYIAPNAMKVNHDNTISFVIKLEKGKTYTISMDAKNAK